MEGPRSSKDWDAYAERLRLQLPVAPDGLIDGYVSWAPWVAIIFGVFGLIITVGGLLLGAILTPFLLLAGLGGVHAGAAYFVALVLLFVGSVVNVGAGYLMLQRSLTGWWLLAIGIVLSMLHALVSGLLFSLVLDVLIAYVHLEAKPRYHRGTPEST
jgi:hypothetical protein